MKLLTKLLLPLLVSCTLAGGYFYWHWIPHTLALNEAVRLHGVDRCLNSIALGLSPLLLSNKIDTVVVNLDELLKKNPDWVAVRLVDGKGRQVYPLLIPPAPAPRQEGKNIRVIRKRLAYLGTDLGELTVHLDIIPTLAVVRKEYQELLAILIGIFTLVTVTAIVTLEVVVRRPAMRLSEASRRLAQRDFDAPLPEAGSDEIGTLVHSFATMRAEIATHQSALHQEIDERTLAEEALKKSEAKLREITSLLADGVYVLDAAGKVTFINEEAQRLLGWTEEELLGLDGHAAFHYKQPDGTLISSDDCPVHLTIRSGEIYRSLNDWLVHKDGSIIPVAISASPIIHNGCTLGSVAAFQDITPRREAERALQESEQRFRETLEHAPIGMAIGAMDWHFQQPNRALCELLGYERDEFEQLTLMDLTHPDDMPVTRAYLSQVLKGELNFYKQEKRYLRKNGDPVWVQVTSTLVRNQEGEPSYFIVQMEDINSRRSAEQRLLESERRFRLISTAAKDSIIIMGSQGTISYWNPAAEEMFGYQENEALGSPLHDLLAPPQYRERYQRAMEQFRSTGEGILVGTTFEITALHKNGNQFPIELSISAFQTKNEWHALALVRDISERKQTEEKIRQLAYYDTLTGLPNRVMMLGSLNQALLLAKRHQRSMAIMFLDLDGFKQVNDSLGHDAGDELLKAVALRLTASVRQGDNVSRQGGDEFIVVLSEIAHPQDAALVAEKVLHALETPFLIRNHELRITSSIGITVYPVDGPDNVEDLMKKADTAMYAAKGAGKNRFMFYQE